MSEELGLRVMHFLTYLCHLMNIQTSMGQFSLNYRENVCTQICTLGTYGNKRPTKF